MPDHPIRVLVVDDDFATRLLACEALMAEGFETSEAEDGEDALRQLETTHHDVLLVDVNMPGISGYDVCRAVRARPGGDAFSILVMTASDDVEAVEMAFSSGATDFMTKPLNLPLLGRRTRFMLRAAEATRAAREAAHRLTRAQQLAQIVNWRVTADGTFAWESDPYVVLWPEAPSDYRRLSLVELVHPLDRDKLVAALTARSSLSVEVRLCLPDGSERVVRQHAERDGDLLIGATQDITAAKLVETQIEQLAFYDDLTGIPNLQFLTRYLAQRGTTQCAAFCIELGSYDVAPLVGSVGRDMLVRAATSRVLERVRGDDTRLRLDQIPCAPERFDGATLVVRISTDELCVVTTAFEQATMMLRQVSEVFARPFTIADQIVTLAPRFGFATYPDPVDDVRDLADRARVAMQEAEPRPPRNVVVFGPVIDERRRHRDRLAYELSLELDADEAGEPSTLRAAYVRRSTDRPDEQLARAVPSWGPSADEPALLAELISEPRMASRMARWLVRSACEDARRWLAADHCVRLAIPVPFLAIAALSDVLQLAVALPPRTIEIELTGPAPRGADMAATLALLEHLRAHGVRIIRADIDARTPIAEIVGVPLDGVCVAMQMITAMPRSAVAGLVTGCRSLHLDVAVSGVAIPADQVLLESLDVTEISGPFVGPFVVDPTPADHADSGLFEIRFRSM